MLPSRVKLGSAALKAITMQAFFQRLSDKLLDIAVDAERKKAGLEHGQVMLPFGTMQYFQRGGTGAEATVMVHGAASDKSSWVRLAAGLERQRPLLIPDLPGHGDSPAGTAPNLGIGAQAEHLRLFLAALGIERAHLIGNSMGGAVALRLAATNPALVASLILIDSAGAESTPSYLRTNYSNGAPNPMIDVNDVAGYRAMIKIGMSAPPYIPGFLMGSLARRYQARRDINARVERDILADLDQTALLAGIGAKTLIIWGQEDKVVHVGDAALLHQRLVNSRVVLLPGIGHVPMVEVPKQVALLCNQFYRS